MYSYREVKHNESFNYGVVTYLDGEGDAVSAEGYVRGETMGGSNEPIVAVVEPEQTVQLPFDRVVKIRYELDE